MKIFVQRQTATAGLLLLVSLLSACATNPVSGKQDFVLMSESQEIALGQKSHQQILTQYEVYKDPALQAMVNRVGKNLAAQSHRNGLNFTFTVLDSPEVNAFALPGGYIYITRGILAYLNSEEELAGVIGHEIGHVTARHGVKQQSAQTVSGLLGVLAAVATKSQSVAQTTSYIGSALISGYGRNHELEADRLGAEYLARINYNPESMLDVIGVLKNQELFAKERAKANGGSSSVAYHGVFSSHPDNDQRLQEVIRAAKKFQTANPIKINAEPFLKLSDGLAFGDSESQGIIRKNHFYHRGLNLHMVFPKNWQLSNRPDRLLSVSNDKTQLIQFLLGDKNAQDPRRYLQKAFPKLQQGQARGSRVYSGVTPLQSPWGQRNGRVAAVKHEGKMYILLGVGKQQLSAAHFFDVVSSLTALRASEQKLARGKKLQLIRAKTSDTFASLARQSNLEQFKISRLRLLNGQYPDGEPVPGRLIKIVK